MIQGIVTRLASFSANAKNFCITVVAALLGIAFQQHLPILLLAAAFVVVSFGALDVYYLAQERRFREFYGDVANRPIADALDLALAPSELSFVDHLAAIRSFSTGGFYLLLLLGGAALWPVVHKRAEAAQRCQTGNIASAATADGSGPPAARITSTTPRPRPAPAQSVNC